MIKDIPLALAGLVGVGIACQWVAWKVRLPAILLLLAAGLCAGPGAAWASDHGWLHGWLSGRLIDPEALFGPLLLPLVSLSVALILFEGGLTLDARELKEGGGVVGRLVSIGALVSWGLATAAAVYVLRMPPGLSVLLGAILVVTGPTVIGPLLRFVKPTGASAPILRWEGIVIDPVGALLAVVVFEIVIGRESSSVAVALSVLKTVGAGGLIGMIGATVMVLLLRRHGSPEHLHNPLAVVLVLVVFAGANALVAESGLAAVTVMGIALANQKRVSVEHVLEFKESLSVLLISSLFVMLSARLTVAQIATLDWHVVAFIAVLIFGVRPVSVLMATAGSRLKWADRAFLAFMAPRGIVAAAVASVFALRLLEQHYPEADRLVPVTFAVVAGTVLFYGLSSPWVSRRLGLSRPGQSGVLVIGGDTLAREIALAIKREGFDVLVVDSNVQHIRDARLAGLPVLHANALSSAVGHAVALSGIGRILALTSNAEVNALAAVKHTRQFGRNNVYQLAGKTAGTAKQRMSSSLQGRDLFGAGVTHRHLTELLNEGATIKTTHLSTAFDYHAYREHYGTRATRLFVISDRRELQVVTSDDVLAPRPGETVISLVRRGAVPSLDEPDLASAKRAAGAGVGG